MPASRPIPHDYLATDDDYHTPNHYHNIISPEHRLLWSILERGVSDAIGRTGSVGSFVDQTRLMQDAYIWIMYPRHLVEFHEFSFEGICIELDINPLPIRKFVAIQSKKPKSEQPTRYRRVIQPYNEYKKKTSMQQIIKHS